jgi:hypothetical protein
VRDDGVDHPHFEGLLGAVVIAQKEDFARALLTDLPRKQRRTVATVEAGNVWIGLLEDSVLATSNGEVTHDVQTVSAADRPTRDSGDHDLGHEANQSLDFQDVQAAQARRVDPSVPFVFVAVFAANTLIASRAKCPTAVFR